MRLLLFTLCALSLGAQPRAITLAKEVPGGIVNLGTVATPTVDNDTGAYSLPVALTFSDATSGASIWTCSNVGSDCTPTALVNPVTVSVTDTHVCAVAKKTDYTNSAAKCATITAVPSCTTPTGTVLTESFGDASASCWSGGPSTCDNTWTVAAGTAQSIISTPGTPSANTACTNSLQMATTGSEYIYKTVSSIADTTTIDFEAYVYLQSFTDGALSRIFSASRDAAINNSERAVVYVERSGSSYSIKASDGDFSSVSSAISITINAWHKISLHLQTGAGNSSVSVDGGSAVTFTQKATSTGFITIGGYSQPTTFTVGALRIN